MLALPLLLAVGVAVYSLNVRPTYTATTTFAPEEASSVSLPGNLAGLAGLAGQFGLMPGASGISSDFLVGVLRSRQLLTSTLMSEFADPRTSHATNAPLIEILEIRSPDEAGRSTAAVRRISALTTPTIDRRTGIVVLAVEMPDARLAADVANRMVELLNQFNLEQRQSRSREQRRFAEERLASAGAELRAAETALQQFLVGNRQYEGSPLLTFEHDRLAREVQIKQSVYQGVVQAFEDARIAEVRDTPVLTTIDRAVAPFLRTWPRRRVMVILAGLAGVGLAAILAYGLEFRANLASGGSQEYASLVEAMRKARREVAGFFGRPN